LKRALVAWGENYLYHPSLIQKLLSLLLLPISGVYCLLAYLRYVRATPKNFGIPIVSVGNVTVGGSGKTPLILELARHFSHPAIVLRGYGRQSTGMVVVKDHDGIHCDSAKSGDEAMLYATMLPHAMVIVSEKREIAVQHAKRMGCEMVFLDDGYGKHAIDKLDLLITVKTPNHFCLPSGAYREVQWHSKKIVEVEEGRSFQRQVSIDNPTPKMVLVTAIARPQRLIPYLPEEIEKVYFEDHHLFTYEELQTILTTTGATSLLVTGKDWVKMSSFALPLSLLTLTLTMDETLITTVKEYVHAKKD
jgi:tetraacyldisaccharide 4'-kinase